jgi:acyl carrier protein
MLTKKLIQTEIEKFVLDILAWDSVSPDAHFVNDLAFDALDELEFIMKIERLFDVAMPDDMLSVTSLIDPPLVTINGITEYIYTQLSKVES